MAANKQTISEWFDIGIKESAKHMIVICDDYDYEDYPVYTKTDHECLRRCNNPGSMQRVMEVYNLTFDKDEQLNAPRAMNKPLY